MDLGEPVSFEASDSLLIEVEPNVVVCSVAHLPPDRTFWALCKLLAVDIN